MKKTKNPLLNDESAYKLTPLGKTIIKLAEAETDEAWYDFHVKFLNTSFYMPTLDIPKGKIKNAENLLEIYPSINLNNKSQAIVLFEKSTRAKTWIKDDNKIEPERKKLANVTKFTTGYDFLHTLPPKTIRSYDLMIDFGKDNCLIIEPEHVLWLRKKAIKIK